MPAKKQNEKPPENFPYVTGEKSYNRRSGEKTLLFVGALITLIVVFAVVSLILINKH
jgi:hypothetical protein